MDIADVLRDILVVLVAAKLAAEVAERIGIPAVVGEIVAGILIGPSVLGARRRRRRGAPHARRDRRDPAAARGRPGDGPRRAGQGRPGLAARRDRRRRRPDGRSGIGAMELRRRRLQHVAVRRRRAHGDERRHHRPGVRRPAGPGHDRGAHRARRRRGRRRDGPRRAHRRRAPRHRGLGVACCRSAGIIAVAVAFLVARRASSACGSRRRCSALVERVSRSTGTMVALALAFTLALRRAGRRRQAGPDRRRLRRRHRPRPQPTSPSASGASSTPVGHLFIPVFFLQIGIDADIAAFGRRRGAARRRRAPGRSPSSGKLVSPLGAIGAPGDKLLIGLGMLPRGEVGLIFATIGLQTGVLDDDLYAALLLVVLVTTLATPQLLKLRYARLRARHGRPSGRRPTPPPPDGGWLGVVDGEVRLRGPPAGPARRCPSRWTRPSAVGPQPARQRPARLARRPARRAAALGRPRPRAALRRRSSGATPGRGGSSTPPACSTGPCPSWPRRCGAAARRAVHPRPARRPTGSPPWSGCALLDADDPLALEIRALDDMDALFLAALLGEVLGDGPDPVGDAAAVVGRLGIEPRARCAVVDLVRRPRPAVVGRPPARGARRGEGAPAGVPPGDARTGAPDLHAVGAAGRRPGALGEVPPAQPARARPGRARRSRAHRPRRARPGGRCGGWRRRRSSPPTRRRSNGCTTRRSPTSCASRPTPWPATPSWSHPRAGRTEVRVRTGAAGTDRWWIDVAARDRPGTARHGHVRPGRGRPRRARRGRGHLGRRRGHRVVHGAGRGPARRRRAHRRGDRGAGRPADLAAAARRRGGVRPPGLPVAHRRRGPVAGPTGPAARRGRRCSTLPASTSRPRR